MSLPCGTAKCYLTGVKSVANFSMNYELPTTNSLRNQRLNSSNIFACAVQTFPFIFRIFLNIFACAAQMFSNVFERFCQLHKKAIVMALWTKVSLCNKAGFCSLSTTTISVPTEAEGSPAALAENTKLTKNPVQSVKSVAKIQSKMWVAGSKNPKI